MSTLNSGQQAITFDYKHPALGDSFNSILVDIVKPGLYDGGTLTYLGTSAIIAPFVLYIKYSASKGIRVKTSSTVTITATEANPIIYCTYSWSSVIENWLDFGVCNSGTIPSNAVVFGETTWSGGVINGITYNYRTIGIASMSVPIGTIVAWLPGYFADGSNGTYTAVSIGLPDEWKECTGAALNDANSLIYNGAGRYLPNLTDDRFLMGDIAASAGGIGGSNTIAVSQQPTFTYPNHQHQIGEYVGSTFTYTYYDSTGTSHNLYSAANSPNAASGSAIRAFDTNLASDDTMYSKTDGGGSCTRTADVNLSTGDNRPLYLSVRYITRIK